MVRTRILAVLLAVLAPAVLTAAPVPVGGKAADITELPVASNAMLVVQLNGLERTKDRVVKMLQGVDENTAKEAGKQFDEGLKGLLEGRDLAGLDGQGRAFVAVGPLAEVGSPDGPFVVLLPVKDYKTFQQKFLTEGERKSFKKGKGGVDEVEYEGSQAGPLLLVDTGAGYVVATMNKDTAEAYAGKYEKLTAKKMGTLADAFLSADVGVFLNLERVNEEYAGPIAQGRAAVGQLFQLVGGQLDPAQIEVAKAMIDGLFQVVEDGTGLVIAVEARPEGAGVRIEGAFTAGSESDKVLAAETPSLLKGLADLPKGMTSYSASNWGKGIGGIQRKLGTEFNPDEDGAGRAIEKLVELTVAGGESVSMAGTGSATLTATAFKDAGKVADAKLAVFQALGEGSRYSNLVLKAKPKAAKDAQKHAGFTLHSATVEVDYEASVQKAADAEQREAAIEAMKKLVPEKQTLFFGSDGKRFVQVSAKDWDEAKGLLDQFVSPKAKAGDDPAFAATRKQLPAEAGYLLLSDAGSLINMLAEYAGGVAGSIPGGPGADFPKFGKVKGDPAYMGVALTAKKQSVRFDLFVPVTAVKAVMKAVEEGAKEKKE